MSKSREDRECDRPWTPAEVTELMRLWATGLSTYKIADAMGRSKNSVVGKAHRLGLPARPSPIIRKGQYPARPHRDRPAVRSARETLPPMLSGTAEYVAQISILVDVFKTASEALPKLKLPMVLKARPVKTVKCCWPVGDARPWVFCNAPSMWARPYCLEHCKVAYVNFTPQSAA